MNKILYLSFLSSMHFYYYFTVTFSVCLFYMTVVFIFPLLVHSSGLSDCSRSVTIPLRRTTDPSPLRGFLQGTLQCTLGNPDVTMPVAKALPGNALSRRQGLE